MPVSAGLADAYSRGKIWAIDPYGNDHCCYQKKLSAEHCTEITLRSPRLSITGHFQRASEHDDRSAFHRKNPTPQSSQSPCPDLGCCLKAARGTQELIRKPPSLPGTGTPSHKKKGQSNWVDSLHSFLESTIFTRFLRDPWKVIDKPNLPVLEQDGEILVSQHMLAETIFPPH